MAEITGELTRVVAETEVLHSGLMSPFREVHELIINGAVLRRDDGEIVLKTTSPEEVGKLRRSRLRVSKPDEVIVNNIDRENPTVKELQDKFRQMVRWLVDEQVVDKSLAVKAGLFVRPSSVGLGNKLNDVAYFFIEDEEHVEKTYQELTKDRVSGKLHLPVREHPESAGIRFNEDYWQGAVGKLEEIVGDGIVFTESEKADWVEWILLSHEYGHALVAAKMYQIIEEGGEIEDWLAEMNEKFKAIGIRGDEVELLDISLDERVAVGLEIYMLTRLLENKGLANEKIQKIIWRHYSINYERFATDWEVLSTDARNNGFEVVDISTINQILTEKTKNQIGDVGVDSGYGYPFTEEQLKDFFK